MTSNKEKFNNLIESDLKETVRNKSITAYTINKGITAYTIYTR